MSDTQGHRQRTKDRFQKEGLENFQDYQALELLLFYCIPRIDTKPLAKKLIKRFGSLAKVLEATPEELEQVEGVGQNVSTFLSLITQTGRYLQKHKATEERILDTTEKYANYLKQQFYMERNEVVYLLCLDAKCKLIDCKRIGEGNINSAAISSRKVVETAINSRATSVVLAHNHTSGIALPSMEDVVTTQVIGRALSAVDVVLVDHIIVGDGDCVSLVQSKQYRPEDCRILV